MHLHFKLDEIFGKGSLWKHRTLRTVFDKNASEWHHTTMDEKLDIIYTALDSGKLTFEEMKDSYIDYYLNKVHNKEHVIDSLDDTIELLVRKSKQRGREI